MIAEPDQPTPPHERPASIEGNLTAANVRIRLLLLWALFLLTYPRRWQAVVCFPTVEACRFNPA